jgi:anti-sigma regulatory factor (Ser/Thr protein kinase)
VLTDASQPSPHFDEPGRLVRSLTSSHKPLPGLRPLPASDDDEAFRERLAAELTAAKVPQASALNMLLAASEIVANARQYANGPELVRVGQVNGTFVCEISDRGPGIDDPLAGYLPPRAERKRGAGLWIARQLCSRVELLPGTPGLTVRLWP